MGLLDFLKGGPPKSKTFKLEVELKAKYGKGYIVEGPIEELNSGRALSGRILISKEKESKKIFLEYPWVKVPHPHPIDILTAAEISRLGRVPLGQFRCGECSGIAKLEYYGGCALPVGKDSHFVPRSSFNKLSIIKTIEAGTLSKASLIPMCKSCLCLGPVEWIRKNKLKGNELESKLLLTEKEREALIASGKRPEEISKILLKLQIEREIAKAKSAK